MPLILLAASLLCLLTPQTACRSHSADLQVAGAASLANAYEEIGHAFTQKTNIEIRFSFSSSGKLAQQIEHGAPFDVYAAANMSFVDRVIAAKAATAKTRRAYARGRVVAWTPPGATKVHKLEDLAHVSKISIANPDHAPYGEAAKQALMGLNLWGLVEAKLVRGANVRQAMQYAQTGNADVALTALSLAIRAPGNYLLFDESLHKPLKQGIVILSDTKKADQANQFIAFLTSNQGQTILRRHGLLQPGDTL